MAGFIKGADISTMDELRELGARYYDHGDEKDLLVILKSYGFNMIRLRLMVDPYSLEKESYGAGHDDLETVIKMGKKITDVGLPVLLDFQYSDFWADPGKQIKPKVWKNHDLGQLEEDVFFYTKESLEKILAAGVNVSMVQVGNELTNGLLWPEGKKDGSKEGYDAIARLVSSGIRAVREVDEEIAIMIHLDNGGNNELYRTWFDNYFERGEDFDYIGMSYYPFWHGTLDSLEYNMNDISSRYDKPVTVVEVSMGFSMEDYGKYEGLEPGERKGYATKKELVEKIEYPMTEDGQAGFTEDFITRIKNVKNGMGKGFFWWEPAWIPVPGSGWATPASLEYMNDPGPCGNEWANQALFDYEGNALKALEIIKQA
ncbi:MAG: glycosyl hydrolase 53 family protein [Lachnospiraceae bacterium]|nr:glycosyl hydrolase 53 family protein [Lachnospiraceae bacterium]